MKRKRKKEVQRNRILIIIVVIIVLGIAVFFQTRPKLQVVTVSNEIEDYNYYLESNATKIYKKYYEKLKEELSDNKIDEKEYAKLVASLFIIDYYTLSNKVTNKDIGGVQFIHSELKDKFLTESSATVYKYINNNLYGTRKQKLPEVKDVKVADIESIKYHDGNYKDDNGYQVKLQIEYINNYNYPEESTIDLIHENNKLVIVEIT